jgi:hypothetical protein
VQRLCPLHAPSALRPLAPPPRHPRDGASAPPWPPPRRTPRRNRRSANPPPGVPQLDSSVVSSPCPGRMPSAGGPATRAAAAGSLRDGVADAVRAGLCRPPSPPAPPRRAGATAARATASGRARRAHAPPARLPSGRVTGVAPASRRRAFWRPNSSAAASRQSSSAAHPVIGRTPLRAGAGDATRGRGVPSARRRARRTSRVRLGGSCRAPRAGGLDRGRAPCTPATASSATRAASSRWGFPAGLDARGGGACTRGRDAQCAP